MSLVDDARRERLFIVGHRGDEDLKAILLDAACVVHPTLWLENTPNSILEAFSAGKAVIASNIGCMPELVSNDENGLLVSPGDVASLSNAMDSVMSDVGSQQRYGKESRRRFVECYARERHLKELMSLFLSLVNSNLRI